jgi:hypothetical protein
MQIARLQNEKSVAEIVNRIYDLKPGDSRGAAAAKTLLAANPHLSGNVAMLPAGTPVVVPAVPGLNATGSAVADPKRAAWMSLLDRVLNSAHQASNAQVTGLATTPPKTPDKQRSEALTLLRNDLAQFKKVHTS